MTLILKKILEELNVISDLLATDADVTRNAAFAPLLQGLIDSAQRSFEAQTAKAKEADAFPAAYKTLEAENAKLKELLGGVQTRLQHTTSKTSSLAGDTTRAQQMERHGSPKKNHGKRRRVDRPTSEIDSSPEVGPGPQPGGFDEQLLYSHLTTIETGHVRLEADQKSLEADKKFLEAAQTRLEAAQTRLDASEIRLEASQNQLKADREQLNVNQERLEAGQTRLVADQNRLETSQTRLGDAQTRLEADQRRLRDGQKRLAAAEEALEVDRAEFLCSQAEANSFRFDDLSAQIDALSAYIKSGQREVGFKSERICTQLDALANRHEIRTLLQDYLSELPKKVDVRTLLRRQGELATKDEVAALLQAKQSKLPNKEDFEALFRQQAEENAKAAQAAHDAALASFQKMADGFRAPVPEANLEPHDFWESPDRHPGKMLWNLPVIEADIGREEVMLLLTKLAASMNARFMMERFLTQPSESWHCIKRMLEEGSWGHDDVTDEACQYHAPAVRIIGRVEEYKCGGKTRNGLILRYVGRRR